MSKCSFCGKSQKEVGKLIAGPGGVYICNECVKLCDDIIEEVLVNTPSGAETPASPPSDDRRRSVRGAAGSDRTSSPAPICLGAGRRAGLDRRPGNRHLGGSIGVDGGSRVCQHRPSFGMTGELQRGAAPTPPARPASRGPYRAGRRG